MAHGEVAASQDLSSRGRADESRESVLLRESRNHLAGAQRVFVNQHHDAAVERLRPQTFGYKSDRPVAVEDLEPDGHFDYVERCCRQLVDARQVLGTPPRILS